MLEMAILETHIFKTFGGCMPPDPSRKLAPLVPVVPSPPLKVLDPLEISHAQQFFNLGISESSILLLCSCRPGATKFRHLDKLVIIKDVREVL